MNIFQASHFSLFVSLSFMPLSLRTLQTVERISVAQKSVSNPSVFENRGLSLANDADSKCWHR